MRLISLIILNKDFMKQNEKSFLPVSLAKRNGKICTLPFNQLLEKTIKVLKICPYSLTQQVHV